MDVLSSLTWIEEKICSIHLTSIYVTRLYQSTDPAQPRYMKGNTIAHEMVHAWDHLRFKIDWHSSLRHAACTEIRASSLSGECRFMREFWTRGQWKLNRQHQACVRRRAVISVQARPFCSSQEQAERVVDEVWEKLKESRGGIL